MCHVAAHCFFATPLTIVLKSPWRRERRQYSNLSTGGFVPVENTRAPGGPGRSRLGGGPAPGPGMDWPSATLSAQRAASRHAAAGFDRSMRRLEEADLAFEANRDPYARPMPAYGQPRDAPSYRQQGAAQPNRDYDDASIRGRGLGGYPAVPPPPPMQMQMDYRPALMDQYSDHRPAQQPAAPLAFQQQEQHALYPDAAKLEAVSQELRQILNGVSSAARDVQQQLDLLTSAHGALESRMRGLDDDVVPRVERLGRLAARRAEEVLEVVQNARRAFTERASADDATHATTRASISALRAALEDRPTRRGAIELATDAARRWCESEPAASAWVRREALDAIVETLRRIPASAIPASHRHSNDGAVSERRGGGKNLSRE
ncbi:hypothetical protein M885DRAFT_204941 [Pelagophyceae sp. CCMP2097]|nr:hypothetical protein M885DRAFT_204941 [Pelagophyceae sp. CCMP2097]